MHDQTLDGQPPAPRDIPAERPCLRCKAPFPSTGFGDRVCKRCKGSNAWRIAAAVPDGPARGGRARNPGRGAT